MIGHNYNLKVSNPRLNNNRVPGLVSDSFQPPFFRPQSHSPIDLGKAVYQYAKAPTSLPPRKK